MRLSRRKAARAEWLTHRDVARESAPEKHNRAGLKNFPGQAECVAPDFARSRPIDGRAGLARAMDDASEAGRPSQFCLDL
jgi:hypothetical protein